jgi:hypothetical protein
MATQVCEKFVADQAHSSSTTESSAHLAAGTEVGLNSLLECHSLPWPYRLSIFCQLLCISTLALADTASTTARAFTSPAFVRVTLSPFPRARIATCTSGPHPTTPYYSPPPSTGAQESADTAASSCIYALGVLLLELALPAATADVRTERLAALPSLPSELLAIQPRTAVLILRMTTVKADDRPFLEEVAKDPAVATVYDKMLATQSLEGHCAVAISLAVQFALLCQSEARQLRHADKVTEALECIDEDLGAVRSCHLAFALDIHRPKYKSTDMSRTTEPYCNIADVPSTLHSQTPICISWDIFDRCVDRAGCRRVHDQWLRTISYVTLLMFEALHSLGLLSFYGVAGV